MLILAILVGSAAALLLGGRLYGRHVARVFGEQPDRPTPAQVLDDGVDYVPTKTPVVFAHHFASIAGAGPIVGPIIGVAFGWLPAILWIVVGAIFAGAVHDFAAMYVSTRERGKSIAVIARQALGVPAFLLLITLLVVLMILVTAMFMILSAKALTSVYPASALELAPDQTLFRTNEQGEAQVGGIATMSVLIITALAPLMGWLYLVRRVPVAWCSLIAIAVCAASIVIGLYHPVRIPAEIPFIPSAGGLPDSQVTWMLFLAIYCLLAAGLPVWILLQSRDFMNVHILYVGIVLLVGALAVVGLQGASPDLPAFRGTTVEMPGKAGVMQPYFIWPFLFITIACGACSGFHSLCATGTTAKQIHPEKAARQVGYWGMLLESFLAVCVVGAVMAGLSFSKYQDLMLTPNKEANPVLAFGVAIGHLLHSAFALPMALGVVFGMLLLEGFLVTTLDTAVRLSRYLMEEAWATIFGRYDVFAARSAAEKAAIEHALDPVGAEGLETWIPADVPRATQPVPTRGALRFALKLLANGWFNTGLIMVLTIAMALSGYVIPLWQLFGAGNQLLAGLSLTIVSAWFLTRGRSIVYTLVPALFMLATTLAMLIQSLSTYWQTKAYLLLGFDIVILALTSGILWLTVRRFWPIGGPRPWRGTIRGKEIPGVLRQG